MNCTDQSRTGPFAFSHRPELLPPAANAGR